MPNTRKTAKIHAVTPARLQANRENAKKSTGPRSPEGKAASSRNGLQHGLCAERHIVLDEDSAEFDALVDDLYHRFRPVGVAEEKLVHRIAACQWRLDRSLPIEAALYRKSLQRIADCNAFKSHEREARKSNHRRDPAHYLPPPPPDGPAELIAEAFVDDGQTNTLSRLARYEAALERSIDRTLRQLKAYQAARLTAESGAESAAAPETGPDPASILDTPDLDSESYEHTCQPVPNCEANPKPVPSPAPVTPQNPPPGPWTPVQPPLHPESPIKTQP